MIRAPDGRLRYSPRDLVAYLEGDFASWCDRMQVERGRNGAGSSDLLAWATPDEDEEAALAARKGREYEQRYLEGLRGKYPGLVEITYGDPAAADLTRSAMGAAAPLIYQGQLVSDGWQGIPDFLFRCKAGCACGGHHYTPWDTKLARSAKPYFLVQLCAYAEMLEAMSGIRPVELVFVLGQGDVQRFDTRRFFHYYRQLKRSFLTFQSGWSLDAMPEPALDRGWGRWTGAAELRLAQSDHLSQVAHITRGQVRRLEEDGIGALTALAGCEPGRHVPRVSAPVFERLREQARLQIDSRGLAVPLWRLRPRLAEEPRHGLAMLPPPSDGDVFFDMEGFPYAEGGLEYLFGAVTRDGPAPEFYDWWAHDGAGERAAFEGFIDWVVARRRRDPSLHVYHYGHYETSAVKRLMGKYATREAEVDDLLRGGVFVDLLAVVRQGVLVGTPSYSLKDIEHLYRPPRTGGVISAGGSTLEYQRWIDLGESPRWQESPILSAIREYNLDDCESLWGLRSWLLDRQREAGIAYVPAANTQGGSQGDSPGVAPAAPSETDLLAARLTARAVQRVEREPEEARLDQLVAWLVDFHRREEKPMWWRMFERHDKTIEERVEDPDCLAKLTRTDTPPRPIKRSRGFEYAFEAAQETKIEVGDLCYVAGDLELKCTVTELDKEAGRVELKIGSGKSLPDRLCLIPNESVPAKIIKEAVARFAASWEGGDPGAQAVCNLLRRRAPRVRGHTGGPLVRPGDAPIADMCDVAARLEDTTLCIQGPPGTGKTFRAAAIIAHLLRAGRRIGVTAQSHKVILNLMRAVHAALSQANVTVPLYKVGDDEGDPLMAQGVIQELESDEVAGVVGGGPVLVGGTAWVFSREELAGAFDYLFVDEAGQVSLANAVAVGQSARNLVLIGDQMQLAQPTQGSHPGETGLSGLEYALHGHATIPDDLGIFLGTSRRMHPDVCRFISEACYEGRLGSTPETARQRVIQASAGGPVPKETGILWVPVSHDSCAQWSEEECDAIEGIVQHLLGREVVDREGVTRPMSLNDILLVAPFNAQVNCLRGRLGPAARIGSVDKFQGQEAPVVIVSLCASTLEEAPRGAGFLLSPNRLNVAVSRAQALAIVVGSPELLETRCTSVEEMRLVNLLCHLEQYAEGLV
ncbi:MAG: TM0106 family RecB-like putative nuclease [Gemmatimonadales bacterium]